MGHRRESLRHRVRFSATEAADRCRLTDGDGQRVGHRISTSPGGGSPPTPRRLRTIRRNDHAPACRRLGYDRRVERRHLEGIDNVFGAGTVADALNRKGDDWMKWVTREKA